MDATLVFCGAVSLRALSANLATTSKLTLSVLFLKELSLWNREPRLSNLKGYWRDWPARIREPHRERGDNLFPRCGLIGGMQGCVAFDASLPMRLSSVYAFMPTPNTPAKGIIEWPFPLILITLSQSQLVNRLVRGDSGSWETRRFQRLPRSKNVFLLAGKSEVNALTASKLCITYLQNTATHPVLHQWLSMFPVQCISRRN